MISSVILSLSKDEENDIVEVSRTNMKNYIQFLLYRFNNRLPYAICSLLLALYLSVFTSTAIATIRYVSHNSIPTPPYTTWETAADSIQKCIDYSVAGDTIIVANGTYYESLVVDKYLWLIGSSMDSTVIDGTGLNNTTVGVQTDLNINGFTIIGKERDYSRYIIACSNSAGINLENCKLYKAGICIYLGLAPGVIDNVIMKSQIPLLICQTPSEEG
jgi:nitrous oxidase accessory protein NosD